MYVQLPGAWNRARTICASSRNSTSPAFFQSHSASAAETRSRASTFPRIPASVGINVLTPPVYSGLSLRISANRSQVTSYRFEGDGLQPVHLKLKVDMGL